MEIKIKNFTKFISLCLAVFIIIMSITRYATISIDAPQDYIITTHFM